MREDRSHTHTLLVCMCVRGARTVIKPDLNQGFLALGVHTLWDTPNDEGLGFHLWISISFVF